MSDKPEIIKKIVQAKRVSVPIVGITTADQPALVLSILEHINGGSAILRHDVVKGLVGLNDAGVEALAGLSQESYEGAVGVDPVAALAMIERLPSKAVCICLNAHRWLDAPGASQAVLNLRDLFKSDNRLLILTAPIFDLPIELRQDVILFDEALPDDAKLQAIVSELLAGAHIDINDTALQSAVESLRGSSAFVSEQVTALAITKRGDTMELDLQELGERQRRAIQQVKGLSMAAPGVTYADIGGLSSIKKYMQGVFSGPLSPQCVVRIEEIEKLMAGSAAGGPGDNTGVSQDFLQVLLDRIESNKWLGALFLGPGGSGKSYLSEALAGEFGRKSITLDTGAMKSSHLGASETAIRDAMRTITAVGGDRVLICATCNSLAELRPELQRRLASCGMWFFDLPDATEKAAIWALQIAKHGLSEQARPADVGWSSSDIRDCCRTAFMLRLSLVDAAVYVNCAMAREPERIDSLRRLANGRLSSASYPGAYRYQGKAAAVVSGRAINPLE